ncbi:TRAP transporter large permease [Noviherbaspirillum denitrificans]|uniref:C4-dicarboxylate ABC transporter n=1 Tax=Noviherbaspirillum denitrificans TaxID=1968433 RepID=A0A254T922_9BURK|nr:TRAP transporter large permease subunit [Noviherbaspirillum denitrificans]OWW18657.1 C4-dicarboxylate ABC transporter [Noviherbaspirillum denitrificans]
MRKEVWFGLSIMAMVVVGVFVLMPPPSEMTNGHLGLLMLALVVVAIMLGFPTAFTLMGMGVFFAWLAYSSRNPQEAVGLTLDLMVQRAYAVMSNDVLISIPLFVFMGYLVERANLIDRLFRSLHLAMARVPGSLAVATIVTCAIFATATGIVGAVVTLMGLLAFPAMLKAGYNVRLSAGTITAGGCLGILIPPSVLLIVYGATAGVSVVKLYAGAFFPGIMLATLYLGYVVLMAKLRPDYAPPLAEEDRKVPLPQWATATGQSGSRNAVAGLLGALRGSHNGVSTQTLLGQLGITLLPAIAFALVMGVSYRAVTTVEKQDMTGVVQMGEGMDSGQEAGGADLAEPPAEDGLAEPPASGDLAEPPSDDKKAEATAIPAPAAPADKAPAEKTDINPPQEEAETRPAPLSYWITFGAGLASMLVFYAIFSFTRLEIFKMLLGSFFPLAILIMAVLGAIVFGLATPTEAAAMGSLGGLLLAAAYKRLNFAVLKESVFLTAKTSAMVCWLFVGSSIFSAAFALLGGQEVINSWVLSLDMTPVQFMILAQVIIFLLGWPLEWTEIIVIFMPIFIPLLAHFDVDPLFFGLLVALNLQTAFLSPPVAMAAFYLKGVSPPHVTLNQIFLGMLPFMAIQVLALILLYLFPAIGMWLPELLYN